MRISTRSWPDCDWTSEAYLAACCGAAMWSILILMPVSLVKRTAISSSFLSIRGGKLFQRGWGTGGADAGQAGGGRGGQKAATRERCHEFSSVVYCACASRRGGAPSFSIGVIVRGNRSSNMT